MRRLIFTVKKGKKFCHRGMNSNTTHADLAEMHLSFRWKSSLMSYRSRPMKAWTWTHLGNRKCFLKLVLLAVRSSPATARLPAWSSVARWRQCTTYVVQLIAGVLLLLLVLQLWRRVKQTAAVFAFDTVFFDLWISFAVLPALFQLTRIRILGNCTGTC